MLIILTLLVPLLGGAAMSFIRFPASSSTVKTAVLG